MSNTNTGGPAFPASEERFSNGALKQEAQTGMTLRDYFAAKAMQAVLNNPNSISATPDFVSEWAYTYADAMLKARNQ